MFTSIIPHTDMLTREALKSVSAPYVPPCLSMFMPTVRLGDQVRQNSIRFKNLVGRAEALLEQHGLTPAGIDVLTAPLRDLERQHGFWEQQGDGLAVYLAHDFYVHFRLARAVEARVEVGTRFFVLPLIPLLDLTLPFHLLVLDAAGVRLYKGDGYQLEDIPLNHVALSLDAHLRNIERERSVQWHTSGGASGAASAIFYGQGNEGDDTTHKDDLRAWFQRIDRAIAEHVSHTDVPFILAGVAVNRGMFREVSRRAPAIAAEIDVNPTKTDVRSLHARAWSAIGAQAANAHAAALERLEMRLERGALAVTGIRPVIAAARSGRVEAIYVPQNARVEGRLDAETGAITFGPGEDLINLAAHETLYHGGSVILTQKRDELAAALRY
jgi:hypothetical protein